MVQAQASDAMARPGEEGELTSALRELSDLMKGLAEDVVMESPAHRRALLRTSLPACLRAVLEQTYQRERDTVVEAVQEALRNVARAVARVRAIWKSGLSERFFCHFPDRPGYRATHGHV